MRRHPGRLVVQDVEGVVAADERPVALADDLQHFAGKGTDIDAVAGHDHMIDFELRHILYDRFQRGQVAVDIGQYSQSCHISPSLNRS